MVLIVDSTDWVPEQPWHPVRDQSWAEPGDSAPCCWLPPPPIVCEWPAPIDLGDAGSEPEFWAVGESGPTDPITGAEVAVEVQEVLTVAAVLTTVEPVFAELTPFTEGTPFTEFVDGPFDGFTEASVDAEAEDTELSGKPLQISTKPYVFTSEELLPFLTTQPGDPAPEYSAEPSEEPTLAICEPYPFPLPGDFPLPEPLPEDWISVDSTDDSGESPADEGTGDVSGLPLTDTGSSWFIPDYPIKLVPPLPRRGVLHMGGETVEPEVFPTPDPRVLRGNGELPIADAPMAEESEAPLEPAGPSEDPTYTAYLEFLRVNPQWAEDHGAGGIQLQVITPSAHLPWIELSTPGAARAFDTWYSQTLLTQTPPEDQPTDPAAEPWTPELRDFTRSLSLTPEIRPGTAVIADTTITTDAPVTDQFAVVTTPPPSPAPSSSASPAPITADGAPALAAPEAAGPEPTAEPVATPVPARSSGGASLEPLTIQVEPPTLPSNAPTPSATQPEPASALAVAVSTAAFGGDGAPAALAGLTAAGDAALAGADAALLLEQLRLTALPWWLVRPTRS